MDALTRKMHNYNRRNVVRRKCDVIVATTPPKRRAMTLAELRERLLREQEQRRAQG
jgi:hypothetical protein